MKKKEYKSNYHIRDISGKRFGHLVALYPDPKKRKNGSLLWHCKCDCGKEVLQTSHDLINAVDRGHKPHCGCMNGKPGYANRASLRGKRFGSLKVIRRTDETTSSGERFWECKCDCGNTVILRSSDLTGRKNLHCGCKGSLHGPRQEKYVGKRFGYLTAIEPVRPKTTAQPKWVFECVCGKRVERSMGKVNASLKQGFQPSCGCMHKQWMKSEKEVKGHR